jgi:hypothetical protein
MTSAPFDCRSENVHVLPIVVAKLELGATLEDRPEPFNCLSVDCNLVKVVPTGRRSNYFHRCDCTRPFG